jgi:hypothetical protein
MGDNREMKQLGMREYVLNSGCQPQCCFPRVDFRSMSGSRLCLSFPCGPKTLCDLREVAVNFVSLTRSGCLTSKSASVPIRVLPGTLQAQSYLEIR